MERLLKSQLIVSTCALALGAETFMVAGLQHRAHDLALLFFSTLLLYNLAQLRIDLSKKVMGKLKVSLTGRRMNIVLATAAFMISLPLLVGMNHETLAVFILTSFAALLYVMPFSYRGKRIKGLREVPVIKNILLSAVWALATVSLPLAGKGELQINSDITWMLARRFLFVYSLTVIFDIRDKRHDLLSGMWTLPMGIGIRVTKILALATLLLFTFISWVDPLLNDVPLHLYREALIASGIITMFLVAVANGRKKNAYYIVVVDGAMILQFLIITGFAML